MSETLVAAVAGVVRQHLLRQQRSADSGLAQLRAELAAVRLKFEAVRACFVRVYHWHDRIDFDVLHLARTLVETRVVNDLRVAMCAAADCDYRLCAAGKPMPPRRDEPR